MIVAEILLCAVLLKSAWEDIRSLSVPMEWLFPAWLVLAVVQIAHGHILPALLLFGLTFWGMGYGPGWVVWFFLPFYPYWPVLLLAAGAREGLVGNGDVWAVSAAALVSPWAGWAGLLGMFLWYAVRRRTGVLWLPGLPGVLLGVVTFFVLAGGRL